MRLIASELIASELIASELIANDRAPDNIILFPLENLALRSERGSVGKDL